ncbi:LysE family translocator [Acinetobacter tianfuensis]|uniref:LysE family translocator n=1 Tax=Acinetobacter tianfuensis TaxID=2419603 RepID=A0A3A8EAU0_9GAMM|nr:LysE family translocator [Acinetobacter tianfuensis]RKG31785.1 LysE family translocator [Acinetobacter tianfuensis]
MEHITQLSTYILTLFLAALLPGPGMTGLMFKTLSQGYQAGMVMLLGLMTADMMYLAASIFLLSYITQLSPHFSFYLIVFASLYLLYLAYQFWTFQGDLLAVSNELNMGQTFSAYKDGLMITLSNPKTISFYLALVPAIFGSVSLQEKSPVLMSVTLFTLAMVGGLYIFFSLSLKKVLKPLHVQKMLVRSLACVMGFLALSLLYKELQVMAPAYANMF